MSQTTAPPPRAYDPDSLILQLLPPGPGPYDAWELRLRVGGEVLAEGPMIRGQVDHAAIAIAVTAYRDLLGDPARGRVTVIPKATGRAL